MMRMNCYIFKLLVFSSVRSLVFSITFSRVELSFFLKFMDDFTFLLHFQIVWLLSLWPRFHVTRSYRCIHIRRQHQSTESSAW